MQPVERLKFSSRGISKRVPPLLQLFLDVTRRMSDSGGTRLVFGEVTFC